MTLLGNLSLSSPPLQCSQLWGVSLSHFDLACTGWHDLHTSVAQQFLPCKAHNVLQCANLWLLEIRISVYVRFLSSIKL